MSADWRQGQALWIIYNLKVGHETLGKWVNAEELASKTQEAVEEAAKLLRGLALEGLLEPQPQMYGSTSDPHKVKYGLTVEGARAASYFNRQGRLPSTIRGGDTYHTSISGASNFALAQGPNPSATFNQNKLFDDLVSHIANLKNSLSKLDDPDDRDLLIYRLEKLEQAIQKGNGEAEARSFEQSLQKTLSRLGQGQQVYGLMTLIYSSAQFVLNRYGLHLPELPEQLKP